MQAWESRVRFKCPKCGKPVDQMLAVPEPDYTAEKSSEMTTDDVVEVPCPCNYSNCGYDVVGNRLEIFTRDYVNEVTKLVEFLVGSVEGQITFGNEPFLAMRP